MHRVCSRAVLLMAVMSAVGSPTSLYAQVGALRVERVSSPAIRANLLGEPSDIEVAVYTPPNYAESGAYPVLYLLHGIGGSYRDWTGGGYQGLNIQLAMDSLINAGAVPPMIVVMPTATNRYLGSYYADSPVTGNWATFIARELVAWTDTHYRTLPRPEGRGIAGHSMGGYGALTVAMDFPGVFGSVYAMSPCCLALTEDIGPGNPAWNIARAFRSPAEVAAAASGGTFYPVAILGFLSVAVPDPDAPPFYVRFPFTTDAAGWLVPQEPAYTAFRGFFPVARVERATAALSGLRGIAMDVGISDQFPHIPPGTIAFSERLATLRIPHAFTLYRGDHRNHIRARMISIILPFFGAHLAAPRNP